MQQAVALFQMMYLGWFEELLAAALGASNSTNQQTMHVIWTCNGKCDFYPVVYNPSPLTHSQAIEENYGQLRKTMEF